MKLILTSTNFYLNGLVEICEKLTNKKRAEINFAIINEGYAVGNADCRWIIEGLNSIKDNFGGSIKFVNLLVLNKKEIEKKLSEADVIYVFGGYPEYLKTVFDKSGLTALLPNLLKNKVYFGSSAGAMILGQIPSYEIQDKYFGKRDHYKIKKYLNLVDFKIFPHLDANYLTPLTRELIYGEAEKSECLVYAFSDKSALIIDETNRYFIGDNFLCIDKSSEKEGVV